MQAVVKMVARSVSPKNADVLASFIQSKIAKYRWLSGPLAYINIHFMSALPVFPIANAKRAKTLPFLCLCFAFSSVLPWENAAAKRQAMMRFETIAENVVHLKGVEKKGKEKGHIL